jgi:hypothetical protein
MSERIAEFDSADDALHFAKLKNRLCGSADFDVCGGIHKMYAVMPKIRYATELGDSDEPPDSRALNCEECDEP